MPAPPRLELRGLSKGFGGIRALSEVTFAVAPGSIHALLGENGAGKSTLVKIVTGVQPADEGRVLIDGEGVRFASPMRAREAGVVAVYQDPRLFPHLDVAENVFMGAHPLTRLGTVARRRMRERAQALLDDLGAGIDARRPVLGLSIGEAQFVEFARATASGRIRLMFLDEPTASLTPAETDRLFRLVRRLRSEGGIRRLHLAPAGGDGGLRGRGDGAARRRSRHDGAGRGAGPAPDRARHGRARGRRCRAEAQRSARRGSAGGRGAERAGRLLRCGLRG